jgi:hypothetical protein
MSIFLASQLAFSALAGRGRPGLLFLAQQDGDGSQPLRHRCPQVILLLASSCTRSPASGFRRRTASCSGGPGRLGRCRD